MTTDKTMDGEWLPIESAPVNTPVIVKVGQAMQFAARLVPDAALNTSEQVCDQWQAEHEGECPECWTDNCCWENNVDDLESLQPIAWRPLSNKDNTDATE